MGKFVSFLEDLGEKRVTGCMEVSTAGRHRLVLIIVMACS